MFAYVIFGPHREKTCLQRFVDHKGADQIVHPGLLFALWKVSNVSLLQVKFELSSYCL